MREERWRHTIPAARKARPARPSAAQEMIPSRDDTKNAATPSRETTIPSPPVNAAYPVIAGADPMDWPFARETERPRTMTAKRN